MTMRTHIDYEYTTRVQIIPAFECRYLKTAKHTGLRGRMFGLDTYQSEHGTAQHGAAQNGIAYGMRMCLAQEDWLH